MDPLFAILIALGVIMMIALVALFVYSMVQSDHEARARRIALLQQLADDLGLDWSAEYPASTLWGQIDGVRVCVDRYSDGDATWERVRAWPDVPTDVHIRGEQIGHVVLSLLGADDLQIGDPDFDNNLRLTGREEDLRRILSADVRRAMVEALPQHFSLREGVVEVRQEIPSVDSHALRLLVDRAVAISKALNDASLLSTATADPSPLARTHALRVLAEVDPGAARTVADQLLGSRPPQEALTGRVADLVAAAIVLREEGTAADIPALRALQLPQSSMQELVDRTIATIQSRVASPAAGGLTISDNRQEGAISAALDAHRQG